MVFDFLICVKVGWVDVHEEHGGGAGTERVGLTLRWFDLNAIWIIYRWAMPRMLHYTISSPRPANWVVVMPVAWFQCECASPLCHSNPMKLFRSAPYISFYLYALTAGRFGSTIELWIVIGTCRYRVCNRYHCKRKITLPEEIVWLFKIRFRVNGQVHFEQDVVKQTCKRIWVNDERRFAVVFAGVDWFISSNILLLDDDSV